MSPRRPNAATLLAARYPARRAFITGGASGLGLAMAHRLAGDGWRVGVLDLSHEALDHMMAAWPGSSGAVLTTYAGDVSDAGFVAASLERFAHAHGGLDLVVNNAG